MNLSLEVGYLYHFRFTSKHVSEIYQSRLLFFKYHHVYFLCFYLIISMFLRLSIM